jgi:hypothetical protein
MKKGIIGRKVGMTQLFDEKGNVIPVTVIQAGPCVVSQIKTVENDGYNAIQLGFEDVPEKRLNKPELGHLKKAGLTPKKHLKEFRLEDISEYKVGDTVTADVFSKVKGSTSPVFQRVTDSPVLLKDGMRANRTCLTVPGLFTDISVPWARLARPECSRTRKCPDSTATSVSPCSTSQSPRSIPNTILSR